MEVDLKYRERYLLSMKANLAQWKMESEIGTLFLVASEKGLRSVFWEKQDAPFASDLSGETPEIKILAKTVQQLTDFLNGKRKDFDLPLDVSGTHFQENVWTQLSKIPYGETRSYKEIAQKLKTAAIRAVGTANGKNPLCIIVPCHRVIASNGSLGGYSGGLPRKKKLLEIESRT